MKETILQQLGAVIGALNSITVSGKHNLANLGGSIDMLEKIVEGISNAEFAETQPDDTK